jgi:hypothetical protein
LIIVIFAETFNIPNFIVHAYGSNWLTGWNYRQQLTWTSSSSVPANYQLNIKVYAGSGSSSGYECYENNHGSFPDFRDVRITANDGSTLLPEWEQTYTLGVSATIWFKDTDSSWTTSVVYVYYGNANANNVFDGNQVFIFFDSFDGASLDTNNWTVGSSTTTSQSNSIVTVTGTVPNWTGGIAGNTELGASARWECRGELTSTDYQMMGFSTGFSSAAIDTYSVCFYWYAGSPNIFVCPAGGPYDMQSISGDFNYHVYQILWTSSSIKFLTDGTTDYTETNTNYIPSVPMAACDKIDSTNASNYMDWVFLANYVNPEPTVSSWGAESVNASLTVYAYTNKPSYGPGDTGTLQFWVYNSGTVDLILDNVTIYYPWYSLVGLWGGNVTIVPSTSTVIAPGGSWSYTSSFTVPNDGRISLGSSFIGIDAVTDKTTGSSSIPISLSVPYYYSLQNMDQLLALLMILIAAIVICTLIIVAALFISARRQMPPKP